MSWLCLEYSFFDVGKKGNIRLEIFSWMNVTYTVCVRNKYFSPSFLPHQLILHEMTTFALLKFLCLWHN